MGEQSGRIAKWDNLKFFLILCVVVGHFFAVIHKDQMAESIVFFIYTFHMPAFVFVSGLFSKKTIDEKRFDRLFSYFIMYLVVKYTRWLAYVVFENGKTFSYSDIPDISWYALALVVFYLVTMYVKQFDAKYMMVLAVIAACMSGYARNIGDWMAMSRIIVFYPFFLAGYYLKPEEVLKVTEKKGVKIASAGALLLALYISVTKIEEIGWMINFLKANLRYHRCLRDYAIYGGWYRLIWFGVAALLTAAVISLVPSKNCIISKWGSRSAQPYVLHFAVMKIFFFLVGDSKGLKQMFPDYYLAVLFVVVVLVTCLLSTRPVEIVVNAVVYPKKRKK